jgi:ribonuclease G
MKQLFIDSAPGCVRVAYTVDKKLKEIYIDPAGNASLVGHIYMGRIQNILPGQFAFVDIGAERNAFINLPRNHGLKKGHSVLMQVYKDAYGDKGPYGGQLIKLKGRMVIIFESPRGEIGVSHKITDAVERSRLRKSVHDVLEKGFGAIIRTNAAGYPEEEISAETKQLINLHREIKERALYTLPPALVYSLNDSALPEGLLVDLLADDLDEIWINGDNVENIKATCINISSKLKDKIFFHDGKTNFFDAFHITRQIERALEKQIMLSCGGYITIEQTEACVVIDVNTGAFSGEQDYRAAILKTNKEAAALIAGQLTLRNLSGMIVIDFIDMKDRYDKNKLLETLAAEIKKDRIKTELVGMTELGLVLLTRRKTRPALSQILETDCPFCQGSGRVNAQTHTKTR